MFKARDLELELEKVERELSGIGRRLEVKREMSRRGYASDKEVNDLLEQEVERHAMRKRAYTFCRQMTWKEVARRYLELFSQVKRQDNDPLRPGPVY